MVHRLHFKETSAEHGKIVFETEWRRTINIKAHLRRILNPYPLKRVRVTIEVIDK